MAGIQYQRLRAPAHHGEALCSPPAAQVWQQLKTTTATLSKGPSLWGRSLSDLAQQARTDLWQEAVDYCSSYGDVTAPSQPGPWVLTGHQPELFHPGVWFKSFALDQFARRGAWTINVLIDNDLARGSAVMAPQRTGQVTRVALDRTLLVPYEERRVLDERLFQTFPQRLREALGGWQSATLLDHLWPAAVQAHREHPAASLAYCLARARHRIEQQWGLKSCDVPLSRICDGAVFRWFAAYLLAHAEDVREHYNRGLSEYRQVHRIRSRNHPAPDLAREGSWIESPFWVWSADDPRRRALFVRAAERHLWLSDGARREFCVPLTKDEGPEALQQLLEQTGSAFKLRPRALITTMFLRLLCSDLFVHGIGGAKYDQLTDYICERFLGVRPPPFLVATATVTLTGQDPHASGAEIRALSRRLRDVHFNPQRFLSGEGPWSSWIARRQQWIEQQPPAGQGKPRRRAIRELNNQLRPWVQPQVEALRAQRLAAEQELRAANRRNARDYSLCLFSAERLPPLLLALAAWEA